MDKRLTTEKQHTFTWKISNFNFLTLKKGEFIKSPDFIAESLDKSTWHLKLYPRGDKDSKNDEMACFLRRSVICDGPFEIKCDFKIEMFETGENILSINPCIGKFEKGTSMGYDNCTRKLNSLNKDSDLFDDTLTIKCYLVSKIREPILNSESIGESKVNIDQTSFRWIVKKLNSTCLETAKFPFIGMSQVEITVQAPDDDIKISIRREHSVDSQHVNCRISLLDLDGIEQDSKQASHLFGKEDNESDTWEFPICWKKNKLNSEKEKYLKDDSFTLQCKVSVSNGTITNVIENRSKCDSETLHVIPRIDNFSALKEDINRMYIDKSQTDVKLIVDKKIFPAHKFILSARSPVFLAMFNQDMVEKQSGQVDITDLKAKTLSSLLEFMYTGAVKKMDCEMAIKLLLAADKYQILTLKEDCSSFLRSVLTDSCVCDVLASADLVEDKLLKDAALSFIKKNLKKVLKSVEWKQLVEKNLTLATDITCEISTKMAEIK